MRPRTTGKDDEVGVVWPSYLERRDKVGDNGPMLMPAEDALGYVEEDATQCFRHAAARRRDCFH
jgi:hypothetical protein